MRRATAVQRRFQRRRMISIHALHEESDLKDARAYSIRAKFQSTLSMRRATDFLQMTNVLSDISIHALHEESDPQICDTTIIACDFNPRSP